MNKYLESTDYIDWKTPAVLAQAQILSNGITTPEDIVRKCFKFVRDEIRHSWDYQVNIVTCKASEVLENKTGFCYAKSHLLAALLRANNIPTGLCYQRLTITDVPPFCLHGLNAVYLQPYGWCRIDARGNKEGVVAEFCPPREKLAFPIVSDGEADLPEIWSEPLPVITQVLRQYKTIQDVSENLPDVEVFSVKASVD